MNAIVRAFLSIDIEDHVLLSHISQIQQKLNQQYAKMKIVEPENIHFTMRFFGDTPVARTDQMKECLKQIELTPFEIKIEGIGAFPNIRRPRVVWVGVADNSQMVIDLKSRIDEFLADIGYKGEKEKFTPHATIARIRVVKEPNHMRSNLEELANEPIGNMIVKSVSMKKSILTPSGPIYETLWTI